MDNSRIRMDNRRSNSYFRNRDSPRNNRRSTVPAIISSVERKPYSDVPKNLATPRIVSMSIDHNRPAVSCLDNPVFGKRRSRYA